MYQPRRFRCTISSFVVDRRRLSSSAKFLCGTVVFIMMMAHSFQSCGKARKVSEFEIDGINQKILNKFSNER